jgi:hypothetical protein
MPILAIPQIDALISMMKEKRQFLYHACHLQDLRSYVRLGVLPSRAVLKDSTLPFTEFQTDLVDKTNEVWSRVFFNLSDFSHWFFASSKSISIPNPYGPVLLKLNPQILGSAVDVCISLLSASKKGFSREAAGLHLDDVHKLYKQLENSSDNGPKRWVVKFGDELKCAFPGREISTPELHATYPADRVVLSGHIENITVDPIPGLLEAVIASFNEVGLLTRVNERRIYSNNDKEVIYKDLLAFVRRGGRLIPEFLSDPNLSAQARSWANGVHRWDIESFQFRRLTDYLFRGTLSKLSLPTL